MQPIDKHRADGFGRRDGHPLIRRALTAVLFIAALAGCAPQQAARLSSAPPSRPVLQPIWPFEASDLPVDPAFRFGVLGNGMRYIVRQNERPQGTALVRMVVEAGSLDEREHERGFAHFVEHMAFNGSTNVEEGKMVALLERSGLAFGADTNASTGFERTTYKLDLPRNDPELLGTALMLMRETAGNLTISPEAVERERGVVLSELREGLTYTRRNYEDHAAFFYPGARFPARLAIGVPETLRAADAAGLRAFYEREYTPAETTLIVVGDFAPALVERVIAERFADWDPRPVSPRPEGGRVAPGHSGLTHVHLDPALSERVTASRHGPWLDEPDTVANRQTRLLRQIGYGITNRRLQRRSRETDPPFRGAGFGTSEVFEIGRTTNLIVDVQDGGWRRGLQAAQEEVARALAFGFSAGEVAEQVANLRTASENAAAAAGTQSNASLAAAALALISDEQVPTTPQSALARFEAFAPAITPAAVLAALKREAVPLDDPLLRFQGRTPPQGGAEAIRQAWDQAAKRKAKRSDAMAGSEFAYTDFGPAGEVVADEREPLLGIRRLRFANGVMLNLKRTELERDRIGLTLTLDGGELLDTRDNPHATEMVGFLGQGGLGKHSLDELQSILAGRTVSGSLAAGADAFVSRATTTPRDVELQLQLLAAYLTDPGFRPEGEEQYKLNIANFFARYRATPNAALSNTLGAIHSDNDPRFSLGEPGDYQQLSFAKLKADIGDRLARGAIEIGLVGDIDEERAIALVAGTFGALPAREAAFGAYPETRQRSFTAKREETVVRHTGDRSQALLRLSWPTRDDKDPVEALRMELLERVLRIELTEGLRERLGKAYSPAASSSLSRVYPGYGVLGIAASVDVADMAETRSAIAAIIAGLRAKPVDPDLLQRAKAPLLEEVDRALKSNAGWLGLVSRAQSEADRIDRFVRMRERIAAITPVQVQDVARRYLVPGQEVTVMVLPEVAGEAGATPAGTPPTTSR